MAAQGTSITFGLPPDVKEAKERFDRSMTFYGTSRDRILEDLKFAYADADNEWQWDDRRSRARRHEQRPCLTVNMIRQHNLQIINDAKKNKPSVTVRATGNESTYESAQAFNALVKYIERISHAQTAYDIATEFQVNGGVGYWRIITEYCSPDSFDQDIKIKQIKNPMMVLGDPDSQERDGSDSLYYFLFEDMSKQKMKDLHPEYEEFTSQSFFGKGDAWLSTDQIRIAEYFRKVFKKTKLYAYRSGETVQMLRADELPPNVLAAIKADKENIVAERELVVPRVERLVIVGNKVAEQNDWPGKYIPIVKIIGEESLIEGQYDVKGHTRYLKDTQRMYNYWSSAAVEFGALQTKTPWVTAIEAIDGYENVWKLANRQNAAYLPYHARDENGNEIAAPQRVEPPVAAPVCLSGMEIAQREMMHASGQFEPQLGETGNERTGAAITARRRSGDNSTYHFVDNLSVGIRLTGDILLDLIPKIYDTERVLMVEGEDGQYFELMLNPAAKAAFEKKDAYNKEVAKRILNPKVGKYDVSADVGADFATKREEAYNAYTLLLTQAPDLASIIGDLLMRAADFPHADEAAARLRRMVPPAALGEGASPAEQQLQEENANLKIMLTRSLEEIAKAQIDAKTARGDASVKVYDAFTKRIQVLLASAKDREIQQGEVRALIDQVVNEALEEGDLAQEAGATK